MNLKENLIVNSIIYTLRNHFGDNYTYYPELIKEGFSTPCFSLYRVQELVSNGYQGKQHRLQNRDYIYIIRYFPKEDINSVAETNDIKDQLNNIKYINLINIEEVDGNEVRDEGLMLIKNRDISTQEGVLLYQITFTINAMLYERLDKVKTLDLDVNI